MAFMWDYDRKVLEKSTQGRILLLERAINYGPEKGEKIKLALVKKYWKQLRLLPKSRRLFELLLWNTHPSSITNKASSLKK